LERRIRRRRGEEGDPDKRTQSVSDGRVNAARACELGQRLSSAHREGRGSWATRAEGERGGARLVERVRPGEGEGGSRPGRIAGPKPKGENELFSFSFQNFQSKVLNGF
jgi:hypothetical protein